MFRGPKIWAGVDVGARRKGFDLALIGDRGLVEPPGARLDTAAVVERLVRASPLLVGVDSPRSPAPLGERSRPCERDLVRAGICGIRYTPDRGTLESSDYYAWVRNGLELYDALDRAGLDAIEVFPTASWTAWGGPRSGTRARWSAATLARLDLAGVPPRTSQDARDAVAAALTARLHSHGATRAFGEIVVPTGAAPRGGRPAR